MRRHRRFLRQRDLPRALAPAYVNSIPTSKVLDGWHDRRRDGGVVLHVPSGKVVATSLSIPHLPELPDGGQRPSNSRRATIPRYAVVELLRPRGNLTFEGLELDGALRSRGVALRSSGGGPGGQAGGAVAALRAHDAGTL